MSHVSYINDNEDGTMRILLVEDDKELCDAIKLQLERAGYETDCCGQGQEAFYLSLIHILMGVTPLIPGKKSITHGIISTWTVTC